MCMGSSYCKVCVFVKLVSVCVHFSVGIHCLCAQQPGECTVTLLLCIAGLCVVTADVVPESGSVIGGVVGTQNISLYCDFRNDDTRLATLWFLQTAEDRGAGRDRGQIPNPHDKFILSGDVVTESNFSVNLNTNLTVLSLTDELDDAIISCVAGVGMSGSADFTLRIYRKCLCVKRSVLHAAESVESSRQCIFSGIILKFSLHLCLNLTVIAQHFSLPTQ